MQRVDRAHGHQRLRQDTCLRILAKPDVDLEDRPIDRRLDYGLVEVDPGPIEGRLRLTELCLRLSLLGQEYRDLLPRPGERGLGGGYVSIGLLCVGGSGFEPLARRPGVASELGITRVIERGAYTLGFGVVERGAGLTNGISLLDQTLVDGIDRRLRCRDSRLVLGDGSAVI